MRILFLTEEYPPLNGGCGGIGSYVASMAPMLASRGHEVHVLSCLEQQEHKDYVDRGVSIHRRGQVRIPGLKRINQILKIPEAIAAFQAGLTTFLHYLRLDADFDVIEYPDTGAEGWVFALVHRKPIVAHLHLPIPVWFPRQEMPTARRDFRWASCMERFAVRQANVITCPSTFLVRRLKDLGWLRGLNPEIIPQFIYWPEWRKTQPVQGTPPTVLFLSWLGQNKAPELLVEAISIIREKIPEAKAVFLGASFGQREGLPYLDWVKNSAPDLSGCQFIGYVARDEVKRFISSSRVLAMPSWFENYPMAALEAMAGGRPVVVTATTGVAEMVEKTGAGSVIPPGDPKALAEVLLPFLMDADYAAEVGERARTAVRECLDPEKIAVQREMAYERAIQSFKHKPRLKLPGIPLRETG